jgi:hypothetical protein
MKPTIDNEDFYDENIAPLMDQIIDLCKERDIPYVCVFQLQDKEANDGDPLCCSTVRVNDKNTTPAIMKAYRAIRAEYQIFKCTIVTDLKK